MNGNGWELRLRTYEIHGAGKNSEGGVATALIKGFGFRPDFRTPA